MERVPDGIANLRVHFLNLLVKAGNLGTVGLMLVGTALELLFVAA